MNNPISTGNSANSTIEVPADCPIISEIEAELATGELTLLLHLYGPVKPGPDATAFTRTQLFNADGFLIEHHVESYQGQIITELIETWIHLPAVLRGTPGIGHVDYEFYPTR